MGDLLINIEHDSELSLQRQIRTKLIDLIQGDQIGTSSLPSGRKLANQLGVSRNTVTLAYESLIEDGYLISKERSGFYINPSFISFNKVCSRKEQNIEELSDLAPNWDNIFLSKPAEFNCLKKDNNWADYEYPFIYGQIDASEFPLNQWRDCNRWVQAKGSLNTWVVENFAEDDQELVRNIRQQILTARGINAEAEEVLITLGT